MKKYLISTLTAAAAMAVPAFADGDGSSTSPYSGSISNFNPDNSEGTGGVVYISGITGGNLADGTDNKLTIKSNLYITYAASDDSKNGIKLTDAYSSVEYTFTGTITGNGNWTYSHTGAQKYVFTGSLAGYSGNIDIEFGGSNDRDSYIYFGNGGQAATDTNVSGTGSITLNLTGSTSATGSIVFNYGSYASDTSQAIAIGNSSLKADAITFTGSVNYTVSSTISGRNSSSTLAISNAGYTTTLSGDVSIANITVASGSTLAISGSVDITSPIENSGTVTINSSASFVLDDMGYTGDWSTGATYTLVTGTGEVTGYESLNTGNVSYTLEGGEITSAKFTYDSGTLTVTVTGTEGTLSNGLHGAGTVYNPYFTVGGVSNVNIFTGAGTTVYIATDTKSLGDASSQTYWNSGGEVACNIVIGKAGIYITDGSGGQIHTFSGTISGDGGLTVSPTSSGGGSAVKQHYAFTGDLSGWNGDITISTTNANDYLAFGGTLSTGDVGGVSNQVTGVTGVTAVTNTSVSGNGAIAVDYGTVYYAYTGYVAETSPSALTVTNSSIEAHQIVFAGGVNYDVSADLKGWDVPQGGTSASDGDSSANSTLTISTTGTVTVSGSVSNFDSIVVSENSGLTVAAGASVTLKSGSTLSVADGGTLTLNTAIAATDGTVEFASGASLVLTDAFLASTIQTYDADGTVTIITASAIYYGDSDLSNADALEGFASIVSTSDNYKLSNWDYSDGVLSASVTYLPEPELFSIFFGLGAIGLVATRRRRR